LLEEVLGVSVVVQEGAVPVDQTCIARDNCHDPMAAGQQIYSDGAQPQLCAMGFHITRGLDDQFLSAGHCSYGTLSNYWYTGHFGYVGSVIETSYEGSCSGETYCRDIARLQIGDAQTRNAVYDGQGHTNVIQSNTPVDGSAICGSLPMEDRVDCGTVQYASFGTMRDDHGVVVAGLSSVINVATTGGDSGSPFFQRIGTTDNVYAEAVLKGYDPIFGQRFVTKIEHSLLTYGATVIVTP
jgi:hypothetical protein